MPLALVVMLAHIPRPGGAAYFTNNDIQALPDWAVKDRYDIEAKVSEADLAEWQKPQSQAGMLRAMLAALLVERCKLEVHTGAKEVATYSLVVGKGGPKFKESNPADSHPSGVPLPGGGTLVPENSGQTFHLYSAAMTSVTPLLSNYAGRPVQDKTGLAGNYDFQLVKPAMPSPSASPDNGTASDPGPSIFSSLEDLGLKLEPSKSMVETLVVDHMERPSEN